MEAPNDVKCKFKHYVGNKYQAAEAMTEPSSVFRAESWIVDTDLTVDNAATFADAAATAGITLT